jgi:hypothetical protein
MKVELFPSKFKTSIINQLKLKLRKAKYAKGTMAFFTLGGPQTKNLFGSNEWKPFKDGWICVDLHFPTNLDNIDSIFKNHGVEFWIHVKKITPKAKKKDFTRISGKYKVPNGLLHSKYLILDYDDNTSEVIIGSHNWTLSALSGLNIEQSVSITANTEDPVIVLLKSILETTRSKCEYYGNNTLSDWKEIQDEANGVGVKRFKLDVKSKDLENQFILYSTSILKTVKRGVKVLIQTNDGSAYYGEIEKSVRNRGANAIMENMQVFKRVADFDYALESRKSDVITSLNDIFYYHIFKLGGEANKFESYSPEPLTKEIHWIPSKSQEENSEDIASLFGLDIGELTLEPVDKHNPGIIEKKKKEVLPWSIVKKPKK